MFKIVTAQDPEKLAEKMNALKGYELRAFTEAPIAAHGEVWSVLRAVMESPKLDAAESDLLQVANAILTRWDLEPEDAIFPGNALRSQLRNAIAQTYEPA